MFEISGYSEVGTFEWSIGSRTTTTGGSSVLAQRRWPSRRRRVSRSRCVERSGLIFADVAVPLPVDEHRGAVPHFGQRLFHRDRQGQKDIGVVLGPLAG